MINLILAKALCATEPGCAYNASFNAATITAGTYGNGDKEWDDKNQKWLDSDDDTEPYPDDLTDIDGDGYRDSHDAATEEKD